MNTDSIKAINKINFKQSLMAYKKKPLSLLCKLIVWLL